LIWYNFFCYKEATALSVATTLKNLITPFLLRRSKDEVQNHISLPNKSEQVLFCSLTEEQRELYKGYLMVCQLLLELVAHSS
jgi:DNA excision repair protein ERCC-6